MVERGWSPSHGREGDRRGEGVVSVGVDKGERGEEGRTGASVMRPKRVVGRGSVLCVSSDACHGRGQGWS